MRRRLSFLWLGGLVRHRALLLAATASGIALAVSLVTVLGAFLTTSQATMTQRARASVAADWQVEVQRGGDAAAVHEQLVHTPGDAAVSAVHLGQSTGFGSTTGGSSQTTGPGVVLGLGPDYRSTFPDQVRQLAGSPYGVQLAQQTAANLKVAPGDTVSIGIQGGKPVTVTVAGVVDLPQANSLFQRVGAPPQSQPVAPPDNVLLLPDARFSQVFGPVPGQVTTQFHVRRDAPLPNDPAGAYTKDSGAARNVEAASAGAALVGDNLGAALDGARGDAAYARMLFLFLGLPGVLLSAMLTVAVVGAGAARRRSEQALLRTRGVAQRAVVRLAAAETALVAVAGSAVGILGATVLSRTALGAAVTGSAGTLAVWAGVATVVGLLIAVGSTLVPVWRDLRSGRVLETRRESPAVGSVRLPWWLRSGLDVILLVLAGVVFWASSGNNYSLVLAPEGVPTISVSYWAFLGPALLWLGAAGLLTRVVLLGLRHGRPVLERALRPVSGRLAAAGSASMSRRRPALARAVVLLALALSFAASTATFNATYAQQAEVDALLTNGADVTVTLPAGAKAAPGLDGELAAIPGVKTVEGMQHRFAYVGADLQDLYGVHPDSIASVTALQDAYFTGGTAAEVLHRIQSQPDSIVVSAETVKDYQLHLGDTLKLRLPDPNGGAAKTVPFRYAGIVNEFPTAPKDSFFVANADYVAKATGNASVNTYLVDTGGSNQQAVAAQAKGLVGTDATVTDITQARGQVGSSLTSVSLDGLTRIELAYAIVLSVAAGALVLGLGIAERRRSFAILSVLGAKRRQLSGLVAGEGAFLVTAGILGGGAIGAGLSAMLVKVLTGVFDPPPSSVAVPGLYLIGTALAVTAAVAAVAGVGARGTTRRPAVEELREL
ncbi:FtsX-like permease family protein [Phycicoccus sp. MAQZ13P-2]|uniref:FtsX-like permease family protein n=1 Tax=Phycicoccus mangrovi TaxID=2840470 RepID=UPI001BFFEAC5|nr:FtsX-like permease family protein [Phycicoccus mangrovi]MBT9257140.1 FtsX-like permease family protein [Phycicoccus mangrovi]MBT9276361.1 FtsX-like permease family protein [Phycicoccus mangrovi]